MTAEQHEYDVRAWVVWLLVAAGLTLTARHPLYTLLMLPAVQVVAAVHAHPHADGIRLSLWRFGSTVIVLSTLFNMLSVHVGQTVLFRLPAGWPLIGGIVTLEAAVYGAGNGLTLITLLAVFTAFNRIVPVHQLLRLTPRALRDLGVVVLIALTYVPETQRHLQQIREAQAIRGHRLRGWRDWRPLVLPLLIGGLERAMRLAEAMVARGYGATADERSATGAQVALAVGLAGGLAGWVAALWVGWPGWVLMTAGVGLVAAVLWQQGRQTTYTRFRTRPWRAADSWLLAAAVLPLVGVLLTDGPLAYNPYPRLTWPPFDVLAGAAVCALALPAALPGPTAAETVEGDGRD